MTLNFSKNTRRETMKKFILPILLIAVVVSLTACGTTSSSSSTNTPASDQAKLEQLKGLRYKSVN
jgi:ABC-type glycerol-3-phosphate transport system substrate-binding protein